MKIQDYVMDEDASFHHPGELSPAVIRRVISGHLSAAPEHTPCTLLF